MIHAFSFKNFYSFKDETTVDFRVSKNAPNTKRYFVDDSKTRLSKIEMIIGANASGKTNAIKPLAFLQWFIIHSFSLDPEKGLLPIQPFAFDVNKNKHTELKVVFEMNKDIYEYFVTLTPERVQQESLTRKSVVNKNISTKTLFARKWNDENKKYEFNKKGFDVPADFILRENASVISTGYQYQHKQSADIVNFWRTLQTNVVEVGWSGGVFLKNSRMQEVFEASLLYHKDNALKERMEKMIRKYDLGLFGFNIIEMQKDDKGNVIRFDIQGIHNIKETDHALHFEYESSGTKQLFAIIPMIIRTLEQGGIAVIDEFESNLHPEIVEDIIELFIHPETNRKNAQIIFTINNHYLLEDMDKYQVNIVEKDLQGVSEIYNLSEFEENIKKDDNLYRKYNAGAYGGVPNIG